MDQLAQPESKVINGVTYQCAPFMAFEALQHLMTLKDILGDSIGGAMGQNVESIVTNLGGKMSNAEVADFVLVLMSHTHADNKIVGEKSVFNTHFQKRMADVFKVLAFVLEVNYGDFFDELRGAVETISKTLNQGSPMKSGLTSPNQPETSG